MHGYKLACVALIQMECSASKERVVARVAHHWRTRIRHAALRLPTKARTTLQRFDLFAPGLQRGRERNGLSSALCKRDAWQERPRCGACLRTRFARFCGKANHSRGLCFICRVQRVYARIPEHAPASNYKTSTRNSRKESRGLQGSREARLLARLTSRKDCSFSSRCLST